MNKLIKNILVVSLFIPFASNAIECDIKAEPGVEFTFSKLSQIDNFNGKNKYKFWFKDRSLNNPINYFQYYKRSGKIKKEPIVQEINNKNNKFEKSIVKYYPAVMDNCETIYLRVNTDDKEFKETFSKNNYLTMSNKYPDFHKNESLFNVIFKIKYNDFNNAIGKDIYVKSQASTSGLLTRSRDNHSYVEHSPHTKFNFKALIDSPFNFYGKQLSPYSMLLEKNGEEFYAPAQSDFINLKNKFSSNIRDQYKNDIKIGKIRYGMNKFEVQSSWGVPELVRRQVIYLEKGMGEIIMDYGYPYAKKEFIYPRAEDLPVGIESDWYYYNRLPDNQYLVFDKFGLLREYNQVFGLNKNNVDGNLHNFIEK
jgi:hypothetical protein